MRELTRLEAEDELLESLPLVAQLECAGTEFEITEVECGESECLGSLIWLPDFDKYVCSDCRKESEDD
ncbi:hypothetical protein [Pseudoalteromonas sp.]|uniref:hypothetical protein n=1 Tax=Pseudoalteromonas sp. TaxID=53249 RepID=UPI003566C699